MDNLLLQTSLDDDRLNEFANKMRVYSENSLNPIYIIDKPLGSEDRVFEYGYKSRFIFLCPKLRILLVNCGNGYEEFETFCDDITDDLEYLSKKYSYQKYIGRKRNWSECIERISIGDIFNIEVEDFVERYKAPVHYERIIEFLISLFVGSINNIEKIGVDVPETLLDKVKNKIILFDGMQSRFVYEKSNKKRVKIQGLAGTGKTELLLHKLKEVYINDRDSRIAFTCHNKVLARYMRDRIPHFFNFMRVEEQIEWDSRLWVFPSWGSSSIPNSGLYSYVCQKYGLKFRRFSDVSSFDEACRHAIVELEEKGCVEECFDYVFIDESQDFSEKYFDLCDIVTKKQIFIAGDIFQDVFDSNIKASVTSDYLLNKCYRTDPKTLMVAHSIDMGLYEKPVIRWLDDDEWEACGYTIQRTAEGFLLKRSPLRRFEDIDTSGIASIKLIGVSSSLIVNRIIDCITEIVQNNATVKPDDLAIILLGNNNIDYSIADRVSVLIQDRFKWESTKGYITKTKEKGKVYISNTNNVKGLEFPFVICVEAGIIHSSIKKRNSIYMALTRSFLSSYFLINDNNYNFITTYEHAVDNINQNGFMTLREPSEEEKRTQAEKVRIEAEKVHKSMEDIVNEVCSEYTELTRNQRNEFQRLAPDSFEGLNEEEIKDRIHQMVRALLGKSN